MEEVRQQVQEEGREARNLVAFHVAVDAPGRAAKASVRASLPPPPRRAGPRVPSRLRSASAGRDKRSELRARYWALLFGNLRQCVGEIYNTVEGHENLNECQEVILVLENYTRDFKALGEWFRLKWAYENTPPPQRPQSLAWEIRKTDFVGPEARRPHSVKSSPSVSGKNSPCLSGHNTPSGKNSPNLTGKASPASGKISPRIHNNSTSPKGSIEFFSSKISTKTTTKPDPKVNKESRLSDIKEKDFIEDVKKAKDGCEKEATKLSVEIGKAKEIANVAPKQVIVKSSKRADNKKVIANTVLTSQAQATINKLNAMESDSLANHLTENAAKNENLLNRDLEKGKISDANPPIVNISIAIESIDQDSVSTESPSKSEDNFADISNESSKCDDKIPHITNNKDKDNASKLDNSKMPNGNFKEKTSLKYDDSMVKTTNDIALSDFKPKEILKSEKKAIAIVKTEIQGDGKEHETTIKNVHNIDDNNDHLKDLKKDDSQNEANKDDEAKKDELKKTEVKVARPAYSQAAAKPKLVTAKTEVKTPTKALARSKTVVEIGSSPAKSRTFINRNQKSKCSYPFNLTTGRTGLFDGTAKNAPKKANNKPATAAGDNRTQIKNGKNQPPRPMSLKINETGDKHEKINPNLEKIKDIDEYSSSDTIVTQIDMSRIESSESLKTIVPENELDVANSIEVLNIDASKNDNEGWLTVKSRRLSRESKKSKSHWANRFHQPSATTSLPTLNMIESPKSETNPITTSQLDRAKSEQPQKMEPQRTETVKKKPEKEKDTSMIRQKSDVTGLKTKSSRSKALKKDKKKDEQKLTKNRLHSSLESLSMGLARSQESTEDAFDFDKWKAEFKSTFKYLEYDDRIQDDTEILKTADPSEMSEIAEMTSQIEENERKISLALDFQSEVDQRKLCEEEDLLNRQIMELQRVSDVEVDTETDDTETDAEIVCESALASCPSTETLSSLSTSLEDQYETALAGMTWADRAETLGALEALVARDPGRAQQLHSKLSQGIKRRGSLQDALRRLQAKQARAERQRTNIHSQRAHKIHQLLARVEEVKVAKNQLIDEKRMRMERRLQKAAENRDQHLKDIVRKAHDEEEKLREIAFIKQLEAENRRHEFLEQCRSHTTRLREMRRERLDKLEQKAAREAAVGLRRQAIEAARKQHVESLLEKKKERDARVEELKEQKRQERDDAAREKAEGVKSRLSALAAAAELEADALRSRIRDKQDASQQRLESHLQAIREKATGPRQPTTSESQEPDKDEEEAKGAIEHEKREKERQKNVRRKARKLRQKLIAACLEAEKARSDDIFRSSMIAPATRMHKLVSQLHYAIRSCDPDQGAEDNRLANNHADRRKKKKNKQSRDRQASAGDSVCSSLSETSPAHSASFADTAALEKHLNELHRMCLCAHTITNVLKNAATAMTHLHAIKTINEILYLALEREDMAGYFNNRILNTCVSIVSRICAHSKLACSYFLTTTGLVHCVVLLQALMDRNLSDDSKEEEFSRNLAEALSLGLNSVLVDAALLVPAALAWKRAHSHSVISLIAVSGCLSYPDRIKDRTQMQTLINVIADLVAPVGCCDGQDRVTAQQSLRSVLGPGMFMMREDLCRLFSMQLSPQEVFVKAARIVHVLRALAELDHRILQESFGEGGWPLELMAGVASLLAQHAPSDKEPPRTVILRHDQRAGEDVSETFVLDLIMLIGFLFVNNQPLLDTVCTKWSVIKLLCNLPANWMVSSPQMHKLLPTLLVLASRPELADAIASEINMEMLQEYLTSSPAQSVAMIRLLRHDSKEPKNGKKTHKSVAV